MTNEQDASSRQRAQPIGEHPLSFLGHELRTPLAGIIGLAGSLLNTPLEPSQRDVVRTIEAAGEHLAAVVDRAIPRRAVLCGATRAGEPLPFDPGLLAVTVGRLLAAQAAQRGIDLSVHPHRHLPAKVLGDAVAVRQVLVNLIANAVRETTTGSVTVRVKPDRSGTNIRFEVADTAGGMPEFAVARLRGSTSGPNPGLGLSICHELVSRMGGHIDAICDPGHGTLVWFSVPLEIVAPEQSFGTDTADPNRARVLVASDDPVNAQVALALLQRLGYAVDLVGSGIEALRAWRTTSYDVCMFDAALPQLDGAEVTACIRRLEENGRRTTPVIGLVAGSTPIDRQRCTAAGMDGLLPKPIELGALMALLARYAPARRTDDTTAGHQLVVEREEGGAA